MQGKDDKLGSGYHDVMWLWSGACMAFCKVQQGWALRAKEGNRYRQAGERSHLGT